MIKRITKDFFLNKKTYQDEFFTPVVDRKCHFYNMIAGGSPANAGSLGSSKHTNWFV